MSSANATAESGESTRARASSSDAPDRATEVDAVVLGLGPGGEAVAGRLAEAGLRVIGIEAGLVGGECPYWACVPTKMMVRAAGLLEEGRRIPGMAGASTIESDWTPVARRIRDDATDDWDDEAAADRFVGQGGTLVRGRGRLVSNDTVVVDGHRYRASRAVVLATGSTPAIPPIDGLDDLPYWTNRDAVEAEHLPASLIVLGGGAVGAEFSQTFARFGVDVTIVETADQLVPSEEPEAGETIADVFRAEGITVVTGDSATKIACDDRFHVQLERGEELTSERLLVATGRRVDLAAIGADTAGFDTDARALDVDEHLRAADGIWAVGDITGHGMYTHVAVYQAGIAAADILGEPHEPADYAAVPRVTFTDPEIGAVGLTEQQARDAGIDVAVGHTAIPSTARGWIHARGNEGFVQLVVDRDRGVLVGGTAVGPSGGEVIGMIALAVHSGMPVDTLRTMIYAYPTFHRGIDDAIRSIE